MVLRIQPRIRVFPSNSNVELRNGIVDFAEEMCLVPATLNACCSAALSYYETYSGNFLSPFVHLSGGCKNEHLRAQYRVVCGPCPFTNTSVLMK